MKIPLPTSQTFQRFPEEPQPGGLHYSPLWEVIDSSKINDWLSCPRYYFFRHILGWEKQPPSFHLDFGTVVHTGLESITAERKVYNSPVSETLNKPHRVEESSMFKDNTLRKIPPFGYPEYAGSEGYLKAFTKLNELIPNWVQVLTPAKSRDQLEKALTTYPSTYSSDDFRTLFTEVSFKVFIPPHYQLHGRVDAVVQDKEGYIWCLEHKTGSTLSSAWKKQFQLSTQVGAYTHALNCIFPTKQVRGVIVNGIIFNKTQIQFHRIYVRKNNEMMQAWMDDVRQVCQQIEFHTNEAKDLVDCKDHYKGMQSNTSFPFFPRNPTFCNSWFGCDFYDYCTHWANPLKNIETLPMEFKIRLWDPRRDES